jgi:hypothetical protein
MNQHPTYNRFSFFSAFSRHDRRLVSGQAMERYAMHHR